MNFIAFAQTAPLPQVVHSDDGFSLMSLLMVNLHPAKHGPKMAILWKVELSFH